ncbi:hypothetical protein F6V30_06675 [Oryzomonas sagensis]|uniref:Zinc resistance-associated protein n=1 Tax=Oryzomonas sagensis TaxID=2603857 RepID=A0ABQ6TT62_9BACT|nr:hypothetical protein [Oryzomonas sagensis]KAB0672243.1 hypothetical protein F6V30_06675 [Oryzomonas sagensis]
MKAFVSTLTVLVVALAIGSMALADDPMGGMNGGCAKCAQNAGQSAQFRKFQQDTLDLRQEMMNRRFELQRENLKGVPDAAKVAALQADIAAIQARIGAIRVQSGLPTNGKRDGECVAMGMGCGRGMNPGCNGKPCPNCP